MTKIKLSEICDLQNGYAFKSTDYVEESNTLSCRMSNIRLGGIFDIEYNSRYLPDSFAEKFKSFLLQDGDLVIAMTDLANDPKLLGVPTLVQTGGKNILLNQRVGKIIIKDSSKVDNKYLQYVLNDPKTRKYYKKFASGGLQINLGKSDLLNVEIFLPPLAEQRRIASILDKADELCLKRQQAIEKLDQLLQATFIDMFGDPVSNPKGFKVAKLAEQVDLIQIGPFGTQLHQEDYIENGIPLINPSHIKNGKIIPNDKLTVSKSKHEELTQYHLRLNDVLLGRRGEMGRCAVVTEKEVGWLCGTGSLFIRPNREKINPFFLELLLSSDSIKKYLENVSQGQTMANLNKSIVGAIPLILPSIEIQNKFFIISEKIDKMKSEFKNAKNRANNLFESLQNQAFSGNL
ncbi:restriction endonuclease subunit S [Acinetobacter schindleri]|nr:restriction endonuclease subunit S [Acinetobacter schindleri]